MKWIRALVAISLVALWLPAVNHCLLEQVEWVEAAQACCPSSESKETDAPKDCSISCCPVEYAVCVSSTSRVPTPNHAPSLVSDVAVESCIAADRNEAVTPKPSPPELIRQWQFVLRAALPPRAPSFVS